MNLKDLEKRKSKFIKYNDTIFDEAAAIKSSYAILGGDNHLEIEEAIAKVYDKFEKRYDDFIKSDEFLNCKEEQEAFKQESLGSSVLYATQFLIDLLKEDGYLREKLGKDKETKLYEEFYTRDDTSKDLHYYNHFSTLSNCLKRVIEKRNKADKYKDTPLLSDGISCIKKVPIKREVGRAWFDKTIKVEIDKEEFLKRKLASGQTFAELLGEVHVEYIKKTEDDLVFEIKMLAFARAMLETTEKFPAIPSNYPESVKFRLTQDYIWKFFLKRDKTGRYATYDKRRILKKLWTYQNKTITFVEMRGNEPVLVSRKLYEFDEILLPNKSEYYLSIDTSAIDFSHINYLYMDLTELEKIESVWNEYWEGTDKPKDFKKIRKISKRIKSNQRLRAAPFKFHILQKYKYNKFHNFKNEKTGYMGNRCQISNKELNIALGDIGSEIARVLETNHYVHNHKNNETSNLIRKYVLAATFYCAKKLKWIVSSPSNPTYDEKKQEWEFNLNASYFDPKAKKANLKILKNQ
jgi:hypothetical protein